MSANGPPESDGLIGRLLHERYRILSELGRGGMATIYLAEDIRLSRHVVIKVPHMMTLGDPRLRQRFLIEVRDLSAHEHPHILGIQDFGEHEGIPFAVLQFLGGGDLSQRLRRQGGAMTTREILTWLRPIAAALDFVHSKGCLHRDVKSANILFDDQGHPFLSDFGIATALDMIDSEAETIAPQDQLTSIGTFVGSPAYAPPEAIDRLFMPSYDQYSLATVVYVALCGSLPFSGKTSEAILIAKAQQDPAPLPADALKEKLPGGCNRVLQRALSRDPEERYDSCTEFAEAFAREATAGRGVPRVGRGLLVGVAAALALTAAVMGARWLFERAESGRTSVTEPPPPTNRTVSLGSNRAELTAAFELCQAHSDHCEAEEFDGEVLHDYTVRPTLMDRFEVSNADFARHVEHTGTTTTAEMRGYSWDGPSRQSGLSWRTPIDGLEAADHPDLPVVHVGFEDASAYCASRDARLPTADEWEYHARGAERRIFPWGDEWDDSRLRWSTDHSVGLEPVGSHPDGATPAGIHDMAGSVWEWTASRSNEERIIKGASWDDRNPSYFRAAAYAAVAPDSTSSDLGFRCIRDRAATEP